MSRPASHNHHPWTASASDYRPDTFSVTAEAKWFFDLWRNGHEFERLRRDIMPYPGPMTLNSVKRMEVLEMFEGMVRRATKSRSAA